MRFSRPVVSAAMIVFAMGICDSRAASQQKSDSAPKLRDGFDVNAVDRTIDPCVDFYHYSCGTWLKDNPVPSDKAVFGRSTELADRNRAVLEDILEKVSAPSQSRNANEQKIGDYYASCMDQDTIEKKGADALRPELARIDALKGKDALPSLLAHYSLNGTNAFFGFGVQQDAKDSTQQIAIVGQGGFGFRTAISISETMPSQSKRANSTSSTCKTCWSFSERNRRMPPHTRKSPCGLRLRSRKALWIMWRGATPTTCTTR